MADPSDQHVDQRDAAGKGTPDDPLPVPHRSGGSAEPEDTTSPEGEAHLAERSSGANEEKVGDDAAFRQDDTAPGVDPDRSDT